MMIKLAGLALALAVMSVHADDGARRLQGGGAGSIACEAPLVATQATPSEVCVNVPALHWWPISDDFGCHGWRGEKQNGNLVAASADNIRMSDDCTKLLYTHFSGNLLCSGDGVEQSYELSECTTGMGNLFNKGRDFSCCSDVGACTFSDSVPYVDSGNLANMTVFRDGRPCRNQKYIGETEAPTGFGASECRDDPAWRWQVKDNRGCAWVGQAPGERCGLMGANESTWAYEHCLESCGCSGAPSAAPVPAPTSCPESATWFRKEQPAKDCAWVRHDPAARCEMMGDDGTFAWESCQASCGCSGAPSVPPTPAPSTCANDPDW